MASSFKLSFVLFFSSLFLHAALAEIECESLPKNVCAFSIASSGKRCLLETYTTKDGSLEYLCKTSDVVVEKMADYIETDRCVKACGVDRNAVGISSDALLEPEFASKLCSPACYQKCPNIVDLYYNLAAGEGAYLPDICQATRSNPHRSMLQLLSSGGDGIVSLATAPASSPFGSSKSRKVSIGAPAPAPA